MKLMILTSILFIVSLSTRLYTIQLPNHVCWDEYHFTRMVNSYLNNIFFLDVHPPLGKLLLTVVANYHGYTGNFSFIHVGITYADYFPYIQLRMFVALFSSLVPVLCFLIVLKLSSSHQAAVLTYILILSDTAYLTMGRLILLDSFLYVFVLMAFYFSLEYLSNRPLSYKWYFSVSCTGVFMALACSVKFVGLFVIILIGLMTLNDIWQQLKKKQLLKKLIKQLCFYFHGLIILPIILYISVFFIHFKLLYKSGPSDMFFSTHLQACLLGNPYNISNTSNCTNNYLADGYNLKNGITFWEKIIEYHMLMIKGNNNLKVKEDDISSKPWHWPISYRAHPVSGPYFLVLIVGNPLVWFICFINISLYTIYINYIHVRKFQAISSNIVKKARDRSANVDNFFESKVKIKNLTKSVHSNVIFNKNLNSFGEKENNYHNNDFKSKGKNLKISTNDAKNILNENGEVNNSLIKKTFIVTKDDKFIMICNLLWIAWFLHYLPFWLMNRVVFLHHYLSAQLFAVMLTGICLTHSLTWLSKKFHSNMLDKIIFFIFISLCIIRQIQLAKLKDKDLIWN